MYHANFGVLGPYSWTLQIISVPLALMIFRMRVTKTEASHKNWASELLREYLFLSALFLV